MQDSIGFDVESPGLFTLAWHGLYLLFFGFHRFHITECCSSCSVAPSTAPRENSSICLIIVGYVWEALARPVGQFLSFWFVAGHWTAEHAPAVVCCLVSLGSDVFVPYMSLDLA